MIGLRAFWKCHLIHAINRYKLTKLVPYRERGVGSVKSWRSGDKGQNSLCRELIEKKNADMYPTQNSVICSTNLS